MNLQDKTFYQWMSVVVGLSLFMSGCTSQEKVVKADADLRVLAEAIEMHWSDLGRVPSTKGGIKELVAEGYLVKWPVDPWGVEYKYEAVEAGGDVRVKISGSHDIFQELMFKTSDGSP